MFIRFSPSKWAFLIALSCGWATAEEPAFVPPKTSQCTIRVTAAKVLNQFTGKAFFPIDIDPGFVLTVEFLDDCKVLDKKAGDQAHLGFHSVAEAFGDPFGDVNGRSYTVDVTRMVINGKVRFNIRKALGTAKVKEEKKE
jgi:hypothetical protein